MSGSKANVLVVDDQEVIRDTLQTALDDEGFNVETAANGKEALEILGRWKPCVVLLDLMMPVMDGWALIHKMREEDLLHGVPVVVFSAHRELRERAKQLDPDATLRKPFELQELQGVMERLISRVPAA